jgi:hypothetical protein
LHSRILVIAAILGAALCGALPAQARAIPAGGWVWYYQHVQASDAAKFRAARAVVVADQTDDAAAVAEIHAQGALAFHYVNVYWYPSGRTYQTVDIALHSDWAFCESGTQPAIGRTLAGVPWYYANLNERGMYDSVTAYLRSLKAAGYDGVFFDIGTLALGTGPMRDKVSTCTQQPVVPGATFADAYARVVVAAHAIGLHVVLNYTTTKPLRTDVAAVVDRRLFETEPGSPIGGFAAAFARRRAEEAASAGGPPRYVEEIKTAAPDDRAGAFLGWAEAALWRIDLTVNSGDDACPGAVAGSACSRYGTFPELTRVVRGPALDAAPSSRSCTAGSTVRCVWVRRWQDAIVLANTTTAPVKARISAGHRHCRAFRSVWGGGLVRGGKCTASLTVTLPAMSGRVYTETSP